MTPRHSPSSERAAHLLAVVEMGHPTSQRQRSLLRQLRQRIEGRVATGASEVAAEAWHAFLADPREREHLLADLLDRLGRDDPVTRHFVELLAPPEPAQRREISYEKLVVAIEETAIGRTALEEMEGGGGFTARLLQQVVGKSCAAPVDLSFCDSDPEAWLESFVPWVRCGRHDWLDEAPAGRASTPETLGADLFRALFHGPLRDVWNRHTAHLDGRPDTGLQVRLVFDPATPAGRALAALPWELARDPEDSRFLAKTVRTPVVRSLETGRARGPIPDLRIPRPLLLLSRSPEGTPGLDVAAETRGIEDAWRAVPGLRVERAAADLDALRDRLHSGGFDVLHYMGHGGFHDATQEGVLFFEGGAGATREVPASVLAEQLADLGLRLVVLGACHGGALPRRDGAEPFAGVAAALLRAGVPAVVAMQFPISDGAAIAFSGELHRQLAAGNRLEVAVTEARLALARRPERSLEWVTPVLYLRR